MKASLFFRWFDIWVGAYIDRATRTLYVCPIPTVGIRIQFGADRPAGPTREALLSTLAMPVEEAAELIYERSDNNEDFGTRPWAEVGEAARELWINDARVLLDELRRRAGLEVRP